MRGFEVGATDYVSKPFRPQELCARVRTLLTLRAQQRDDRGDTLRRVRCRFQRPAPQGMRRYFQLARCVPSGFLITFPSLSARGC